MTAADVYVVLALALLALAMWYARRVVGVALKALPTAAAIGGTWAAIELYGLGQRMNWDSPGSPAILVVIAALGAALLIGLSGWLAVALQVRSFIRPAKRKSRATGSSALNSAGVALAIVCVVGALLLAYRYYRSHQPSHDETVQIMEFAPDGEALYSLDRAGVLKRWYAQRALEADRWVLPEVGAVSALLVSDDGSRVAAVTGDRVGFWRLAAARAPELVARLDGFLAVVPVDAERFALLARNELSVRGWDDPGVTLASIQLPGPALAASAYGDRGAVVGLANSTLKFYDLGMASIVGREVDVPAPLRAVPRAIRADRTGRFLAVSDGGTALAVLDLQIGRQDTVSLLSPLAHFAISERGRLLIAELVAVRSYDLASGSSEPLFNHGGPIGALAAAPALDTVAIADRENIWLRSDSENYAASELWLTGAVQVARLADAVLPGEPFAH
jgi:hypothetical protein